MPLLLARGRGLGKLIGLFISALAEGDPFAWTVLLGGTGFSALLGWVAWHQKRKRRHVLEQLAEDRAARPKRDKTKAKTKTKTKTKNATPKKSDATAKQKALRAKAPRARPRRGFDEDEHPFL